MLLPRYLLIILALYVIVFLVSLAYYIGPAISLGLGYLPVFYASVFILLLPLILSLLYFLNFLSGHDTLFRIVIVASVIVSFIYFFVFIFTLLI